MKITLKVAGWLSNHLYILYKPAYFLYKRLRDRDEARIMRACIRRGDHVLDIGANIGFHSRLMASLVGEGGRVSSYEPSAISHRRLLDNTRQMPQVIVQQAAVASHNGTVRVFVSKELSVDDRVYKTHTHNPSIEVRACRLDDHIPTDRPVSFVKIDIQGSEVDALQGMRRILTGSNRMMVLCECSPYALEEAGSSVASLLDSLESAGLVVKLLQPRRLVEISWLMADKHQWGDPYYYQNLLAYHPSQEQLLKRLFP